MAFCTKCGAQVAGGTKFCNSCGNPMGVAQSQSPPSPQSPPQSAQLHATPQQQPQIYQQPYRQQPPYEQPYRQQVYTEEPVTTGGYMLMFLLLMIPIVNFVCMIVWACGGSSKKNKVNLARAMLLWTLIGMVISGIIVLAGSMLFGGSINELMELGKDFQ